MLAAANEIKSTPEVLQHPDYGYKNNVKLFASRLRSCRDSNLAKHYHAQFLKSNICPNRFLSNLVIEMLGKCGCVAEARAVFDELQSERNLISWNIMIQVYAQNGQYSDAHKLFKMFNLEGMRADVYTFANTLSACFGPDGVVEGRELHARITACGYELHVVIATALVNMYAKCGMLDFARDVFDRMPERNVISWTTMVTGYAQNGHACAAKSLFDQMHHPNIVSWTALITGYANNGSVEEAKKIFDEMPQKDLVAWTAMLAAYLQNGLVEEGSKLFARMPERNTVSWNVMISGCVRNGNLPEALHFFQCMPQPDIVSQACVFSAYAQHGHLKKAKSILDQIPEPSVFLLNSMVLAYSRYGHLQQAKLTFDEMRVRNLESWNSLLYAYAKNEQPQECFNYLRIMDLEGVQGDDTTFVRVIDTCRSLAEGRLLHFSILSARTTLTSAVGAAVIRMYGRCSDLDNAKQVFDEMKNCTTLLWNAMISAHVQNKQIEGARILFEQMPSRNLVSWTAMMAAYAQNMYLLEAREMFDRMPERNVVSWNVMLAAYAQDGDLKEALKILQTMDIEGQQPDEVTLVSTIDACASVIAVGEGELIHAEIVDKGLECDIVVVGNALVNMYGKFGNINTAKHVFWRMKYQNVVSWTAIITAYAQNGYYEETVDMLRLMLLNGFQAQGFTLLSVLSACSHAGLVSEGRCYLASMHMDYGITATRDHYSCMIDHFSRAGRLEEAHEVMRYMPFEADYISWTTVSS